MPDAGDVAISKHAYFACRMPASLLCRPKAAQEDAQERIYHQSQYEQTAEHAVVIEIES
jgi:hypothetical protein